MGFESDLFVKGTPAEITIIDPERIGYFLENILNLDP